MSPAFCPQLPLPPPPKVSLPLAHLSVPCPVSSPADKGPHIGHAGVGVGVGAGGGRRGSPRLPPWPQTTWCPWSRPDRPPGRPPCGRSPRLSGGGRRPLCRGPPGCSPPLRGSPGGWAGPPSRRAAELGEGGRARGVRPRESAWPGGGGCAAPPPQPVPGYPPFLRLPPRGGVCGAGRRMLQAEVPPTPPRALSPPPPPPLRLPPPPRPFSPAR